MVLRPHVLQWNGTGPKEGQGDRDVLEADPLHDPEADDEAGQVAESSLTLDRWPPPLFGGEWEQTTRGLDTWQRQLQVISTPEFFSLSRIRNGWRTGMRSAAPRTVEWLKRKIQEVEVRGY